MPHAIRTSRITISVEEERAKFIVKTGRVFEKAKKLHRIESLHLAVHTRDRLSFISPLTEVYAGKWGSRNLQKRANILDFIRRAENFDLQLEWSLLVDALDCIKKPSNKDVFGVSILILRAFVFGNPEAAVAFFCNLLSSTAFMESFVVHGSVFGKESSGPTPAQTRAILPLPAVLAVADALVALKLHQLVDSVCIAPAGVMFGARKGTQVLDVALAAQLHLQRGGDNFGLAGLVQGDIATYYDSLDALKIAHWLVSRGLHVFWASCFLRLQMLPNVHLSAGGSCVFPIKSRTSGSLTGSRSAVAAGRIPVESTASMLANEWKAYGVRTDNASVTFAS